MAKRDKKVPKELAEKPDIYPHLLSIWEAFGLLHKSRPQGMAPGYIPMSEILAYVLACGVPFDDFDFFMTCIVALDHVYMEHQREKSEKEQQDMKNKSKQTRQTNRRRK